MSASSGELGSTVLSLSPASSAGTGTVGSSPESSGGSAAGRCPKVNRRAAAPSGEASSRSRMSIVKGLRLSQS